jgi:glycosyltransferase involved in cell wall biosynthesis
VSHGKKGGFDLLKLGLYNVWLVIKHAGLIFRSDILYANGPRQFPGLLVMSWLFRKRCIYHIHIDHSSLEKKLIALAARLKSTHRIIVNSNYILDRLESDIPNIKDNSRVTVIENCLSPRMSSLPFDDRFNDCQDKLRIAVIGVLRPEKGQDRAISLALRNRDAEIHLIGRIGSGAQSWVYSLKRDAPENVFFHGETSDIPTTIQQLGIQVVLVPSRWQEPFGLVAIEGMACSCITIVFNSGALADISTKTGALVCNDETGLYILIDQLLAMGTAERAFIARNQYERTMNSYGADRFITEIHHALLSNQ